MFTAMMAPAVERLARNYLNTGINPPIVIFVNQKKRADVLVKGQSVLYKRSIF